MSATYSILAGAPAAHRLRCFAAALAFLLPCGPAACHIDRLFGTAGSAADDGNEPSATAVPTRLAFTRQPGAAIVRAAITPPVEVAVVDQFGETFPAYNARVTLELTGGSGRLLGETSRTATGGIATFAGIVVDRAGGNYRLTARADGLETATSATFEVMESPDPDDIALRSGNAQSDTAGATLSQPYVVRVTSSSGDPIANISVHWSVQAGGGSMAPLISVTSGNGEAESLHTLGTIAGVQLVSARVDGLSGTVVFTSRARHASPATLVFARQPTDTRPGRQITPSVQVRLEDRFGNLASDFGGEIALSIAPLTGTPGATLSGDTSREPDDGVATFSGLSILLPGLGYRLLAQSAGLQTLSASFNVL